MVMAQDWARSVQRTACPVIDDDDVGSPNGRHMDLPLSHARIALSTSSIAQRPPAATDPQCTRALRMADSSYTLHSGTACVKAAAQDCGGFLTASGTKLALRPSCGAGGGNRAVGGCTRDT